MHQVKPLPAYLLKRYQGWKATQFSDNKAWYARLSDEGQRPRAMVISCCDSRLHVTSVFGAETGEFFIHRNIANLVPPFTLSGEHHGTSAAIEYAVSTLRVSNIIVMGHSSCGGIESYHDLCSGISPDLHSESSFVGRWMDILQRGYDRVSNRGGTRAEQVTALEKECVLVSLENLMTFPFITKAVNNETLALHGVWMNIRDGSLECLEASSGDFIAI